MKLAITTSILISLLLVSSCKRDEKNVNPVIPSESVTTVILQLTNTVDPLDTPSAQWEQLLDNNGNPLPVDVSEAHLELAANATYECSISVLDKSQSPQDTISIEILERGNYHIFFFQPLPTEQTLLIPNNYPTNPNDLYPQPIPTPVPAGTALDLSVGITDHDNNNPQLPIGLESNFVTGNAGTGWLRIVLRHQPDGKDGTYAPGETDLDVGFAVTIN